MFQRQNFGFNPRKNMIARRQPMVWVSLITGQGALIEQKNILQKVRQKMTHYACIGLRISVFPVQSTMNNF